MKIDDEQVSRLLKIEAREAKYELLEKLKQIKWLVKCPNCDPKQIGEKVKGKCPYCNGTKGVYMIPISYIEELEKELKKT